MARSTSLPACPMSADTTPSASRWSGDTRAAAGEESALFSKTPIALLDPGTGGSKQTNTSGHHQKSADKCARSYQSAARSRLSAGRDSAAGRQAPGAQQKSTTTQNDRAGCENGGPVYLTNLSRRICRKLPASPRKWLRWKSIRPQAA